jgi:hypothetical protein
MADKGIGVYDLIKLLREDLRKLRDDPEIQATPFVFLKEVDLELNVIVSKKGKVGTRLLVVTGEGEYEKERINSLKLKWGTTVEVSPGKFGFEEGKEPILGAPLTVSELRKALKGSKRKKT